MTTLKAIKKLMQLSISRTPSENNYLAACLAGDLVTVHELVGEDGVNPFVKGENGYGEGFYRACEEGCVEIVEYLFNYFNFAALEEGSKEYKLKKTLLRDGFFIAAQSGHLNVIDSFKMFEDFEFSTHGSFYIKHLLINKDENPQIINIIRKLYEDFSVHENKLFYSHISNHPEIENEVKKWDLHNELNDKLEPKANMKKPKI